MINICPKKIINLQNQMPTTMSLLGGDERQLWILSFLLCGIIAAVAIISAVFFVIKRHPHAREKIQNLTMDSEASKDYQVNYYFREIFFLAFIRDSFHEAYLFLYRTCAEREWRQKRLKKNLREMSRDTG